LSNQCLGAGKLVQWQEKIRLVAKSLSDVPFTIFAATSRDFFRKPMPGMWLTLEKIASEGGINLDTLDSFYVGDAAGRPGDHAGTDRKFALNLGLKFYTPEEFFLNTNSVQYRLQGFHISSLPKNVPAIIPSSMPLLSNDSEIVLFVGYPSSGKTTFFNRHFSNAGYIHICQDVLGTRGKCLSTAESSLKGGTSCVIDNTNRDRKTRQYYIELAKRLNVSIRCFFFQSTIELSWHNNLYRAFCQPDASGKSTQTSARKLVPYGAFSAFKASFEEPTVSEGFQEIKLVNFKFEGSEKETRFWNMWLQIDGK